MFVPFNKKRAYYLLITLTIVLAVVTRTYNYTNRISMVADNSRDVQVAIFAANTLQIPQTGQFSSAGPFFYGPIWYWFLSLIAFIPTGPLTFWYVSTILSLIFIYLIYKTGFELGGRLTAVLAALYAAISPAQIQNSLTVWNPSIVPMLSLIGLFLLLKFTKSQKPLYAFLISLSIGSAITIHFQSILLLPILLLTLVIAIVKRHPYLERENPGFQARDESRISRERKYPVHQPGEVYSRFFKNLILLIIGFTLPFIPLVIFDIYNHWFESRNLLIYLLVDQQKIWIPNRWLTYLFSYWPETWGYTIGGNKYIGILLVASIIVFTIGACKKIKGSLPYFALVTTFLLEILMYRYYRGERYFYYSLFSNPPVILLSAWATSKFFKLNRTIGLAILSVVLTATLFTVAFTPNPIKITYSKIQELKTNIYESFPKNTSFDIWRCHQSGTLVGHPISYLIYRDGRNSIGSQRIGVCDYGQEKLYWTPLTKEDVQTKSWINVSTQIVYETTTQWWKKDPPKKGQNTLNFILQNIFKK